MSLLGIKRARTTAYNPQTNGMIERFHRQLKSSLKAQELCTHWLDVLPLVMLGIRSAIKDNLAATTAELVYGATLRLPAQFFSCDVNAPPDPTDFVSTSKEFFSAQRVIYMYTCICAM